MSKKNWLRRQAQQQPGAPTVEPPIGPDAPTIEHDPYDNGDSSETPEPEFTDGIEAGQIWEDVIVPDRPVNVLSLTPGAKLQPLLVEGPFDDGTGDWCVSFVGEAITKIRADAEMLKTGKLRS